MKKRFILLFSVLLCALACQKSGTNSSIAGEWYYSVDDIGKDGVRYGFSYDHYILNRNSSFEYRYGYTRLKSRPAGTSGLSYATQSYTYFGTYEFSDGVLTLYCDYHIDDDSGEMNISAKTFTYKILTSPVTSSTTTIEVFNNQEQQTEVWERSN